eukprot:TRINITY_DN16099_c1_g1_i2.p1 TRINITY_DN16099_c1_g1~~TRINITY_DN16099_c1_g1_i2.p1  ORF type:complete len:236 (+),score=38.66 TRINITY_DN16099_c1_g1_i2:464-1171(+)
MVANMLASTAHDWAKLFSHHHSGTYNNQWMVLDLQRFGSGGKNSLTASSEEGEGLFVVLEEAPGLIVSADMSARLRKDLYWASYNVAYFPEIRKRVNESSSWQMAPRAQIFRQQVSKVESMEGMKSIMAWNDYLHSNISKGDPAKAIMARGDLYPKGKKRAAGGIDSKVSSFTDYSAGMISHARVGQTHDSVPPFCWGSDPEVDKTPHRSHPRCFNFTWQTLWPGQSETETLVFV